MTGKQFTQRQELLKNVGDRIKQLRGVLGCSRRQMAAALDITVATYSKYEYGKVLPGYPTLVKLARLHDLSLDWLVAGRGALFYREKAETARPDAPTAGITALQDVKELLAAMAQSPLLRHQVLSYFFKLKAQPPVATVPTGEETDSPG